MANENQRVELGNKVVGERELPSIDVSKYVGRDAKIEKVEEYQGALGYYVKIETEVVDTLKDMKDQKTKEPIQLRGSRIFGLQTLDDGTICWGNKTKLAVFLKKMNVKHYKELVGKSVKIQTVTNKDDNKDYLSFN